MILKFDLKAMLDDYESRTGVRVSYSALADMSNLSLDTVKSLGSRKAYNATLETISAISNCLGMSPVDYFVWDPSVKI